MRLLYAIVFSACLLLAAPNPVLAGPEEDAYAAVETWAQAINSNDVDKIVALYTPHALFLGTLSPTLATDRREIRKYFVSFVKAEPQVTLGEHAAIKVSSGAVLFAGFYDFTRLEHGRREPLPARYSFLMLKRGGQWLIAHQHSSVRPKPEH